MALPDKVNVSFSQVACVGGGISGICAAVQVQRKLGISDVLIIERENALGGTWHVNRYPGCACDVPSAFYSFSFVLNPNWSGLMCPNNEMRDYLDMVATRYGLHDKTTLGTSCDSAEWDRNRGRWRLHLREVATGRKYTHECLVLFIGVGLFGAPKMDLGIAGLDECKVPVFHTGRWRADIDLTDKDVAVIGNGCTATQLVPAILPRVRSLTQLIRSPHWILPDPHITYGPRLRWFLAHVPFLTLLNRWATAAIFETGWLQFYNNALARWLRAGAQATSERYIRARAPEKYWPLLIPTYEIGCKRRVFDVPQSYPAQLHSPKMDLTNAPVTAFTPTGLIAGGEERRFDAIILATGFDTNCDLPFEVRGENGLTLSDHWKTFGGPAAYDCTAMAGFPNFFLLFGPNSATGHTSVILAVENTVDLALRVAAPVLRSEARAVSVTPAAERAFSAKLQEALTRRVWSTSCNSWYFTTGRNSSTYPWSQFYYWYRAVRPTWSDWAYEYAPGQKPTTFGWGFALLGAAAIAAIPVLIGVLNQ